jgi:hypothetical protein
MCIYVRWRARDRIGRQGDVQAVLDAVVAREVAARLCAGNDIVRAEGVSGIREGNGEHGRTAVLEGANYAAEGSHDGTVQRSRKVFLDPEHGNLLDRMVIHDANTTWGIPMRRPVRSPEFEGAHSAKCFEHNSRAFSRVVGRAAVGSFSSKTERTS